MNNEWNAEIACKYWPDQYAHWVPVSWKDHLYEFNVFYDGTILANPAGLGMNTNVLPEDQVFASELRIRFMAKNPFRQNTRNGQPDTSVCDTSLMQLLNPDRRHIACWDGCKTPVYVIEQVILNAPVVIRQKQFAHIPGGKSVKTGVEPLFLWVRIEIADVIEEINCLKEIFACLTIIAPSLIVGMGAYNNITFNYGFGVPSYPVALVYEGDTNLKNPGYLRISSPSSHTELFGSFTAGKRNTLALPGCQENISIQFARSQFFSASNKPLSHLVVKIPCEIGKKFDFVFPFIPVADDLIKRELALGYDGALKEAEKFWKNQLKTRTIIKMSEPLLQGWVDNFPRLTAMIAQKIPSSDLYGLPSGSYCYEATWPTSLSMQLYALDFLGYGKEVEKYLEPYRKKQGEKKPPSPYLDKHPGYFASPQELSAIDWITDHAAILWAAVNHALMSGDGEFVERWTQPIIKACRFICDALDKKVPGFYEGILPPAVSNDSGWCSQSVWNNAWHHKALKTASFFLEEIGHPDAEYFSRRAKKYRDRFREIFFEEVKKMKKWKASDGKSYPLIPVVLGGGIGMELSHAFYLDTGPLVLVFGELFDADEPEMIATIKWFSEGPQWRIYRPFSSEWQPAVLDHEISSCEPCFSWNIFHSLYLGDREKFTMGLYSLYAAGASRQNFVSFETRNGVSGNCFSHGLTFILTRLCVIQEQDNELHLLKLVPLAFLNNGGFVWKNVPTYFGSISISAKIQSNKLQIEYRQPDRKTPHGTFLHIPPTDINEILINGKKIKYSGERSIKL
ncbi:MAG: hypothetical protein N2115_05845 [bacterium]|nr:hypothetical protein [bacterium]